MASLLGTVFLFSCVAPTRQLATNNNTKAQPAGSANASSSQRVAWRKIIGWPEDCEEAFERSDASGRAGIEFYPLDDGMTLVAVLCAAGAYQPSFRYYLLDRSWSDTVVSHLSFPTYESPDGRLLTYTRQAELWGQPSVLLEQGELTVLSVARQTGDCGTWARYGFTHGEVELREFWVQLPCPAEIGPPVDQKPGLPPKGWKKVDDHDRGAAHEQPKK